MMALIDEVTSGPRIDVRPVFARSRAALTSLLEDLAPEDWRRSTAAAPWTVRDVTAHLLGDDLNRLSRGRDRYTSAGPRPDEPLSRFIHRINDEWVEATTRLSPQVLVELLRATTPQVIEYWRVAELDVLGEPVSWAGPEPAPVWLDCARDYTEYWVHQQQIREAAGRTATLRPDEVHAVLDTFLHAIPHTLREHPRRDGTSVAIAVAGPGDGTWAWRCDSGMWRRRQEPAPAHDSVVTFGDAQVLWRLCTRMVQPDQAARIGMISGDASLAWAALQIVSIIR